MLIVIAKHWEYAQRATPSGSLFVPRSFDKLEKKKRERESNSVAVLQPSDEAARLWTGICPW